MNAREELEESMLAKSNDTKAELERLGFVHHDDLRAFGRGYGSSIAQFIRETNDNTHPELAADIGASIVGGFLLGLEYALKHPEIKLPPA